MVTRAKCSFEKAVNMRTKYIYHKFSLISNMLKTNEVGVYLLIQLPQSSVTDS